MFQYFSAPLLVEKTVVGVFVPSAHASEETMLIKGKGDSVRH